MRAQIIDTAVRGRSTSKPGGVDGARAMKREAGCGGCGWAAAGGVLKRVNEGIRVLLLARIRAVSLRTGGKRIEQYIAAVEEYVICV